MKLLVVLSAMLVLASSYPIVKTWTLSELSDAIQNPETSSTLRPYLEDALNVIMLALFTNDSKKLVLPSPSGESTWTVQELEAAIDDTHTRPEFMPALVQAYEYVMQNNETGEVPESVKVVIPALDISTWTASDLSEALKSSSTKPELIPYLEKARSELKQALENGEERDSISIITPVNLVPSKTDYEFKPKMLKRLIKKTKKGI